ncbi:hypothetical protein FRB99_005832 [Tulasnella sp. 403]|nr:hypothetical protein FRB99_005832 [Tulasnella sp. 403]
MATRTPAMEAAAKGRPPRVDFSSVNPNNLGTLRKLNQVLFPIKYSEKFYKDVLLPENEAFCKLSESAGQSAYTSMTSQLGVYVAELNPIPTTRKAADWTAIIRTDTEMVDMSSMGNQLDAYYARFAPYRSRKLGTRALEHIVQAALDARNPDPNAVIKTTPPPKPLSSLYMHVQISNTDARRFYERNGFKETACIEGYYRKLEPQAAWVLEKKVEPAGVLQEVNA